MSVKRVEALEAVQADLEYARAFYESWKSGGSEDILRKFFEAVEWIEWIRTCSLASSESFSG